MDRNRGLFLIGVLTVGVLAAGCRRQPSEEALTTPEQQAVQETNRFLEDQGITLPEGAERAYLIGEAGDRGVATREIAETKQTYTIVADLAAPASGAYFGWVKNAEGESQKLGMMIAQKGGYVVEKTTSEDWSAYNQVIVSQDAGTATEPGTTVVSGSFE